MKTWSEAFQSRITDDDAHMQSVGDSEAKMAYRDDSWLGFSISSTGAPEAETTSSSRNSKARMAKTELEPELEPELGSEEFEGWELEGEGGMER